MQTWTAWIFLSIFVAFLEIDVASFVSGPFRQYLRDFPLVWLYRDFIGLGLAYAFVGAIGWLFVWVLSLLMGKKGKAFFIRNATAIGECALLVTYGFWALRKFLFLRGHLSLSGFLIATMLFGIFSAGAVWFSQKWVPSRAKRKAALLFILISFAIPLVLRIPWLNPPAIHSSLPNILILSVDTLRPDHLGCYGDPKGLAPNIDRLAPRGILYRYAYTQIPLTAPSFSSIMTGLTPKTHGARENLMTMYPSVTTLAEVLHAAGYRTAAFVSGYPLKRELCSLSKGFDLYQDRFSFWDGFKLLRFLERFGVVELQLERRADEVSRLSLPWMTRHKGQPFFVWLHYYDPHVPYRPPFLSSVEDSATLQQLRRQQRYLWGKRENELTPQLIENMKTLYDEEIAFVDQDIGQVVSFLENQGLREKTLLLFISDHGESFDHDYYFDHGDRLYESCIRIPVLLSYPGVVPSRIVLGGPIQSIDLFPTVLSLLKLSVPPCDGRNLFEKDGTPSLKSAPVYAELSRRVDYPTLGDLWSLREDPWKLIYSPEGRPAELYNVLEDPQEITNLSSKDPERVKEMEGKLIQWMGEKGKHSRSPHVEGLTREKLRSLGYLQ